MCTEGRSLVVKVIIWLLLKQKHCEEPFICCENALNPTALHVLLRMSCRWRWTFTNQSGCTGSTAAPEKRLLLSSWLACWPSFPNE